ncbi:hypothetical protein [Cetobacterium sp. 2G large]|uniref:hypothetical protein n=1 Tax=Cetobacterium sp. 2G large TaxID=2759680 RepID=UPI00163CE3AF|nr:hypothetical protein [Cetobacterium sp. 2G large]MBC2854692.1 hypothetical protein [Cetobacterium sp. 2G large]
MYQKIFIKKNEEELDDILEELDGFFKIILYSLKENELKSEVILTEDSLIEEVERRNKKEEIYIIIALYNEPQNIKKSTNYKDKNEIEILDDLTSIFDKRKINNCFNYKLKDQERQEIVKRLSKFLIPSGNEENILEELKKYIKQIIELDEKLYEGYQVENLKELFNENEKTKLNLRKNQQIKEQLKEKLFDKIDKKYKLIKKNDYSLIKKTYLKLGILNTERFEEAVLDESFEILHEINREEFSKYLKRFYGSGLTKEKVPNFEKYLEKNNLEEKIQKKYLQIKENLNKEISNKKWKEIEVILLKDPEIFLILLGNNFDEIKYYEEELIDFYKKIITLEKIKISENKITLERRLLMFFSEEIIKELLLTVKKIILGMREEEKKIELNYREKNEQKKRKERYQNRKIEEYEEIQDFLEENNLEVLNKRFKKIYRVFEDEEENLIDLLDLTKKNIDSELKKIQVNLLKKIKLIIDEGTYDRRIRLEKIFERIFQPSFFIEEAVEKYLEYEEIRIKYEMFKAR